MKRFAAIAIAGGFCLLCAAALFIAVTRKPYHDPYYDEMPVGTPVELVAVYHQTYKEVKKLEVEIGQAVAVFEQRKTEATTAFEIYGKSLEEVRAAVAAACTAPAEQSSNCFKAARDAQKRSEEAYKQIDITQAAARAAVEVGKPLARRLEAAREKLERDKSDYEAIACGGTRRFADLRRTDLVIKAEKDFVDGWRAKLTNSDDALRAAISRYDAAEIRKSKIVAGGEQFEKERSAASHASYNAFTNYEKASEQVLKEETLEAEAAVVAAYKAWKAARKIDDEFTERSRVRQTEYSAASDEYRSAFEAVLDAAP